MLLTQVWRRRALWVGLALIAITLSLGHAGWYQLFKLKAHIRQMKHDVEMLQRWKRKMLHDIAQTRGVHSSKEKRMRERFALGLPGELVYLTK